jgi:hypothetical protein
MLQNENASHKGLLASNHISVIFVTQFIREPVQCSDVVETEVSLSFVRIIASSICQD